MPCTYALKKRKALLTDIVRQSRSDSSLNTSGLGVSGECRLILDRPEEMHPPASLVAPHQIERLDNRHLRVEPHSSLLVRYTCEFRKPPGAEQGQPQRRPIRQRRRSRELQPPFERHRFRQPEHLGSATSRPARMRPDSCRRRVMLAVSQHSAPNPGGSAAPRSTHHQRSG